MKKNWLVITGYFLNNIIISEHVTKSQAEKAVQKYFQEDSDSLLYSSGGDYTVMHRKAFDEIIKKEEKISAF